MGLLPCLALLSLSVRSADFRKTIPSQFTTLSLSGCPNTGGIHFERSYWKGPTSDLGINLSVKFVLPVFPPLRLIAFPAVEAFPGLDPTGAHRKHLKYEEERKDSVTSEQEFNKAWWRVSSPRTRRGNLIIIEVGWKGYCLWVYLQSFVRFSVRLASHAAFQWTWKLRYQYVHENRSQVGLKIAKIFDSVIFLLVGFCYDDLDEAGKSIIHSTESWQFITNTKMRILSRRHGSDTTLWRPA